MGDIGLKISRMLLPLLFGVFMTVAPVPTVAFEWDVFSNSSDGLKGCLLEQLDARVLETLAHGRPQNRRLRQRAKEAYETCKTVHTGASQTDEQLIQRPFPFIDVHSHILARKRDRDYYGSAQEAYGLMEALKIQTMIVMPPPHHFNQANIHQLEGFLPEVQSSGGKLKALGGGGTLNPMIVEAVANGAVSAKMKARFDKRARQIIAMGAIGFGEMTAEHVSRRPGHPYITAPPDHPLFLHLAEIAAEYDVPIDFHMEAVPDDMATPDALKFNPNPEMLRANIRRFERLLAHNRKAKFIWSHAGWGNTGKRTPALMRRLLMEHSNLFMSLKIKKSGLRGISPVDRTRQIRNVWMGLLNDFPDRFMIGSDYKLKGKGIPGGKSQQIPRTFLRQLPPHLAQKVGFENAKRVFKF